MLQKFALQPMEISKRYDSVSVKDNCALFLAVSTNRPKTQNLYKSLNMSNICFELLREKRWWPLDDQDDTSTPAQWRASLHRILMALWGQRSSAPTTWRHGWRHTVQASLLWCVKLRLPWWSLGLMQAICWEI